MRNKSKMIKKLASIALALLLAAQPLATLPMNVFAGTGSNGIPTALTKTKVTGFEIFGYPDNKTINVKEDLVLTAGSFSPSDAHEDYKKVEWEVTSGDIDAENISVKKADTTATISVAKPGTVTITATAKNGLGDDKSNEWIEKSVEITVLQPVTGITIGNAPANNTMDVGDACTLTATLSPENVSQAYKTVTWESNNTDVAEVEATTGKVIAKLPGTAKITATAKNGLGENKSNEWIKASVDITVLQPVTGITIGNVPNNNTIVGKTCTLTATLSPENVSNVYKTVDWKSETPGVATVAQNGTVTAVAPGRAKITATAKNGSENESDWVTKSVNITVLPITLNKSVLALNSDTNGVHEETLQATVLPEGADQIVSWSSDKPAVATVDQDGTVTAKEQGEATITVTTANGRSATCKVYVCEVVVVKDDQTPFRGSYTQDDIIVDPVKLTFSAAYINEHDPYGWCCYIDSDIFTLTVEPADDSNITIQQCTFYHESTDQSFTSTGPTFSCEAFQYENWDPNWYGITKVDVYFTRNAG